MTSGPPPDEPTLRSSPCLLSPTSPKPIHFPKPTNIPILDLQIDVDFNQTELHMADPAMHNTEVRPGAWQDPSEQKESEAELPTNAPGENGAALSDGHTAAQGDDTMQTEAVSASSEAVHNAPPPESLQTLNDSSENKATSAAAEVVPGSANGAEPLKSATNAAAADTAVQADAPHGQNHESKLENAPNASATPGSVDVQSLLKSLQTAPHAGTPPTANLHTPSAEAATAATALPIPFPAQPPAPGVESSPLSASGLGAPPAGLPARPPPQDQPLIHPNYVHSQHIRDYHPHATNPAFQPHGRSNSTGGIAVDAPPQVYPQPVQSPSQSTANASAMSYQLPTPSSATLPVQSPAQFQYPSYSPQSNLPLIESRRENYLASGAPLNSSDAPWSADIQRKYDDFIALERQYVQEGRWDQFPNGSRLFVGTRDLHGRKTTYEEDRLNALAGNLSSEKVTKRDIFHVFHVYGRLAQISIKQAYGFVQFFSAEDCRRALEGEQGRVVRDKKIHLEVSKPQKNRQPATRRSRSPDYGRGNPPPTTDRYVSSSRTGARGSRDGYRPGYRSPSPPRGYRDRYDDRYRTRSPPSYGSRRPRSPSPRRGEPDDDLPLPRRAPKDVPDVQIIVLDSLDRDFIAWVESAFTSRGIRVDVLLLSPRLDEQAVVRRQIVEGVLAVSKLTRNNQNSSKIDLQLFDRRGGQNNVKFEEYQSLDPPVAAELVVRAKSTHAAPSSYGGYGAPPVQQSYGYGSQPPPSYGHPPSGYPPYQQPPPPVPSGAPPNLQSLITNLDPAGLQNLLSAMNSQQATPATPHQPPSASYNNSAGHYERQQQDALAALRNNPALAGLLQQQAQQQMQPQHGAPAGSQQVNMQEILARLGNPGR